MKITEEQIKEAKKILEEAGYYTKNLWHIDDVKTQFECDDNLAMLVLDSALTNDSTFEQVWESIEIVGEYYNLTEK